MSVSPSAILNRAADLIRDTAAAADTSEPWRAQGLFRLRKGCMCLSCDEDEPWAFEVWPLDGPESEEGCFHNTHLREPDARWIALMSPAVAPMIEKWLRDTAAYFDEFADYWIAIPEQARAALALARAVLGEKEDTDG